MALKLINLPFLLGLRAKPRRYGHRVERFELPRDGTVRYAQWLHPLERLKCLTQEMVDELRVYLAPGDSAIDIGAHSGDSSLPLALAVGPQGTVLALEPNPYVFEVLKCNAALNREKAIIIPLPYAATAVEGELTFYYSDAGFCNGGAFQRVSPWRHGHSFRLRVRGIDLQSHLQSRYGELVERLKLVKVDAEGADLQVLQGISGLLRSRRPFIKAEVYRYSTPAQRRELFRFLHGLGYRIHHVESESRLRGAELGEDDVLIERHFDIFCIPRG